MVHNKRVKAYTIPVALRGNLSFLMEHISNTLRFNVGQQLRQFKITPRHYWALVVIGAAKRNQTTLSDLLQINQNAMVRVVDDLEKRSLATRNLNPKNRREYLIELTPQGFDLLKAATPLVRRAQDALVNDLSITEEDSLILQLRKFSLKRVPLV
jgi:DNA-binding MarR family transcriptional regulator